MILNLKILNCLIEGRLNSFWYGRGETYTGLLAHPQACQIPSSAKYIEKYFDSGWQQRLKITLYAIELLSPQHLFRQTSREVRMINLK